MMILASALLSFLVCGGIGYVMGKHDERKNAEKLWRKNQVQQSKGQE